MKKSEPLCLALTLSFAITLIAVTTVTVILPAFAIATHAMTVQFGSMAEMAGRLILILLVTLLIELARIAEAIQFVEQPFLPRIGRLLFLLEVARELLSTMS